MFVLIIVLIGVWVMRRMSRPYFGRYGGYGYGLFGPRPHYGRPIGGPPPRGPMMGFGPYGGRTGHRGPGGYGRR